MLLANSADLPGSRLRNRWTLWSSVTHGGSSKRASSSGNREREAESPRSNVHASFVRHLCVRSGVKNGRLTTISCLLLLCLMTAALAVS
jgi:hypothetical protein